jgi:hypothetical protein
VTWSHAIALFTANLAACLTLTVGKAAARAWRRRRAAKAVYKDRSE